MTGDENRRTRVAGPRADGVREWETFVRTASDESLRHAGSVTAPTAETAHEHAGMLFPDAETLWLCPTDEVVRFATRTLGERDDGRDGGDAADDDSAVETEVDAADDGSTVEVDAEAGAHADAAPEDETEAGVEAEPGGDRP